VIRLIWRFLQTRNNVLPCFYGLLSIGFAIGSFLIHPILLLASIASIFFTYVETVTQLSFRAPKYRKPLLEDESWVKTVHDIGSNQILSYIPLKHVKSKPTLLLVHGWTSGASRMVGRAELFRSRGWNVILVDLPSHGGSSRVQKWTAEYATTSVLGVMNELYSLGHVNGKNELFYYGHSMGGFIGLRLSERRNELSWKPVFGGWILESPMTGYTEIFDETNRILRIPKALQRIVLWRMISQFNDLNIGRPKISHLEQTDAPIWGMTSEPTLLIQAHNDERLGDTHYLRLEDAFSKSGNGHLLTSNIMEDLRHSGCAIHERRDVVVNQWLDKVRNYSSSD